MGLENPDFLPCLQGDSQAARDVHFGVAIMAAFRPGDWRRAVQEAGGWTNIISSGHPFGTLNDVVQTGHFHLVHVTWSDTCACFTVEI